MAEWFGAFIEWCSGSRAEEVIDVLSDCSNELFVNGLTAMHLRQYGRRQGLDGFWARSEWGKVDVSFGRVESRFKRWPRKPADIASLVDGLVEAKVVYWHMSDGFHAKKFRLLRSQLDQRAARFKRKSPALYGMIWSVVFGEQGETHDEMEDRYNSWNHPQFGWGELFENNRLRNVAGAGKSRPFQLVGRKDMRDVWPLTEPAFASLYVTLARCR